MLVTFLTYSPSEAGIQQGLLALGIVALWRQHLVDIKAVNSMGKRAMLLAEHDLEERRLLRKALENHFRDEDSA